MNELLHRIAVALLLACGVLTLGISAFDVWWPADPATAGLLVHRQLMLGLLGVALVVAGFIASWRLPTVLAAVASKLSWVGIWAAAPQTVAATPAGALLEGSLLALLVFAGLVLAREVWLEARWDAMLPLHPEA